VIGMGRISPQFADIYFVSQSLRAREHRPVAAKKNFDVVGLCMSGWTNDKGQRKTCSLFGYFGKTAQEMRIPGVLFVFEARKRRIIDNEGIDCRLRRNGRSGGTASKEADLTDRRTSSQNFQPRYVARFKIDVSDAGRDQVHIRVMLAFLAQQGAGFEMSLSAICLKQP